MFIKIENTNIINTDHLIKIEIFDQKVVLLLTTYKIEIDCETKEMANETFEKFWSITKSL